MAMTLVSIKAEYTFVDKENSKGTLELYLPDTAALTNAIIFFDHIGNLLHSLTYCNLTHYTMIPQYVEDTMTAPNPLQDAVARVGVFEVETADDETCIITIPSLDPTKLNTDKVTIDQSSLYVQSFITMLLEGDGVIAPCDQRGEDLVATSGANPNWRVLQAYKMHNRSQINSLARGG